MSRWLPSFLLCAALALPIAAAPRVVLVGDSITYGIVGGDPGPTYAELLADQLGSEVEVVNLGCGGTTSLDWAPNSTNPFCGSPEIWTPNIYTVFLLPELPADVVVYLLGTNDSLGFFEPQRVSVAEYGAALRGFAAHALADGATWVLLMTPPPNFMDPVAQALLAGYADEVRAFCAEDPDDAVECGPDLFADFEPEDYPGDPQSNIHPNATGHALIAAELGDDLIALPEPGAGIALAVGALLLLALARGNRGR